MKKIIAFTSVLVFSVSLLLMGGDTKSIEKKYKLRAQVDEKRGITSYMPKGLSARSRIFVYIVKLHDKDGYFLRLRIAYFAEELLHIKRYAFDIGGEELEIFVRGPVRHQDMKSPNIPGSGSGVPNPISPDLDQPKEGGGIVEFYDIAMTPREIDVIKKIAATKGVKMKYEGSKGLKKFRIHRKEIKDIRRVLNAYDAFSKK